MNGDLFAIEIVTNMGSYFTSQFDSILEVKAAIDRGEVIKGFWYRNDGIRFEEDFWFNPEITNQIRTGKS